VNIASSNPGHAGPAHAGRSYYARDRERPRLRGTLAPAALASLRPIAIACFRLVTLFPEPPDLRVPCLRSCMARSTLSDAFFPYFAI
jgi:hypothetical protein